LFHAAASKVTAVSPPENWRALPARGCGRITDLAGTRTLRYDADGLRAFASVCDGHAQDVRVQRPLAVPSAGHQSTAAAVAELHGAAVGVGDVMAARIRSTACAVAAASNRYTHTECGSAENLNASMGIGPA
jgi:hypothetical protein